MTTSARPRVLIVDDSRIVRATIIRHIHDRYEVREEVDGEAGWEALLVDPSIRLVITDYSMPRLDGYGLIARIRASTLGRIHELPVIMLSGEEDESARRRAKELGASDFIAKGAGNAELMARIDTLFELGRSQGALEEARAAAAVDATTGLMAASVLLRQAEQLLSFADRHGGHVGVLVMGMDRFDELVASEGQQFADALLARFAQVLAGTVRKEDSVARWGRGGFAVVTPGTDPARARIFAEQLRARIAGASIHHGGHTLRVSVTIGLAGRPDERGQGPQAVFAAAERRMTEAMAVGGNRVAVGDEQARAEAAMFIDEALGHLAAGRHAIVKPRLSELARRLMPLFRLMDEEYGLGLPIAEIERRTEGRIQDETG